MDFAVIRSGGKQYQVSAGDKVKLEKLAGEAGDNVSFDEVLLTAHGDKVAIGTPLVDGARVSGKILRQARDRKKIVFRFSSKARYRKMKGHRQHFTEVEITKV